MSRRPSLLACLRLALLAMLMLGACLQPALAAACDVEDARVALDADAGPAADAGNAGDAGDCCDNPACGDCCLHAVASLPRLQSGMPFAPPCIAVAPLRPGTPRAVYPVDSRPPIVA